MLFKKEIVYGTLIKRYKRFFSDILLDNGETIVAHTPNTGPMTTCWEKGMKCLLTKNDDPKRKLKYTLEMTHNGKTWISVNTHNANTIVKEALINGVMKEVPRGEVIPEYKVGNSRFDFLIKGKTEQIILEVKNASTISDNQVCIFPDTISLRAEKHIDELRELNNKGQTCVLLFLVAREDCVSFRVAKEIQPNYYKKCEEAQKEGVVILAYKCDLSSSQIKLSSPLPVIF